MFVTTSNTLNIPGPLMDRMEIIRLSGYTEEEKFEIARRHLIPMTDISGLQGDEIASTQLAVDAHQAARRCACGHGAATHP
jgi:ATP-dependent Lon protease